MMITQMILKEVYRASHFISYTRYADLVRKSQELEPGKPEDKTSGFLAYNVPNKDRMKMKTGRFLTRKLKLNSGFLSDVAIQHIASSINEMLFPDMGIRLDKGSAITRNYRNEVGGCSCMTGSCARYTMLYEMNPNRFQQLIMEQNRDSARAIIHKLDSGEFAIDRVYATSRYLENRMKEYAAEQGWLNIYVEDSGTVSDLEYEDGSIPYMDSLRWGTICKGLLTISTTGGDYRLSSQNGELVQGIMCEHCEEYFNEEDLCFIEEGNYCESCMSENFMYCGDCGEYYNNEYSYLITDIGRCVCEDCKGNYYLCSDCGDVYSVGGIRTVDEDVVVCESCSEQYHCCENCSELVSKVGKRGYCEDCEDRHSIPVTCKESDTEKLAYEPQ